MKNVHIDLRTDTGIVSEDENEEDYSVGHAQVI